jgi:hypothetical protein
MIWVLRWCKGTALELIGGGETSLSIGVEARFKRSPGPSSASHSLPELLVDAARTAAHRASRSDDGGDG